MTNGVSQPRKQFLDVLRVLATCAVVLMHVLTGATDVTDASRLPEYRGTILSVMDLVTWCVPVFLLISGYLFLDPDRVLTYPVMIKKYCRRIALAILLFGIPYAGAELVVSERSFRIGMIPEAVWMALTGRSWSHMWYLYLIFFLYLITPLLKKLLSWIPDGGVFIVLVILFAGCSLHPFMQKLGVATLPVRILPDEGVYVFYYLCGYFFAKSGKLGMDGAEKPQDDRSDRQAQESRNRWSRSGNIAMVCTGLLLIGMVYSRATGFPLQMAYNYPPTVVLSLLLFATAWAGGVVESRDHLAPLDMTEPGDHLAQKHRIPWEAAGALSFAVYLVHPVYVNLLYKFMHLTPFTVLERWNMTSVVAGNVLLLLLLGAFCIFVLALSAATAWLLRRVTFLRRYVL